MCVPYFDNNPLFDTKAGFVACQHKFVKLPGKASILNFLFAQMSKVKIYIISLSCYRSLSCK